MKPTLPADCASCAYRPVLPLPGTSCRRHAPTPRQDEFDLVYWPKVGRNDRCGDGAALGDGTGPSVVACQACIHWHQPNGSPVKPDYRPVTNAADSCGAGAQVEVDTNDDEVPALKDAPV